MAEQYVFNEDLWFEILKRATLKTIGIFMCVSKKWYNLIISPYFINAHALYVSERQQQEMFLLREFGDPPKEPALETYTLCLDDSPLLNKTPLHKFCCPFTAVQGLPFRVVGVVNGVILLSDDLHGFHYTFILWNPLVRKYIHLPEPSIRSSQLPAFLDTVYQLQNPIGAYIYALGFGFDPASSDFKVVLLVYPQRRDGLDTIPPSVELYSVREGKWRSIDAQGVDYCITYGTWSQCFIRGSVHWIAFDRRDDDGGPQALAFKSNWLLLFDAEKEKFKRMKVPSDLVDICPFFLAVCDYRGMLAVKYTYAHQNAEFLLDLWVKKNYDVGSSWTKLVSITTEEGPKKALYFSRNGEILMSNSRQGLLVYHLETKTLGSLGGGGICDGYFVCPYTESLFFLEKQSHALSYKEHCFTDHGRVQVGSDDLEEVDADRSNTCTDADGSDDEIIFWRDTWKNA